MATTTGPLPGRLEVIPIAGHALGAEVIGLDLTNGPVADEVIQAVMQALLQHQILVIRHQEDATPDQHIAFSARFGELIKGLQFKHPQYDTIAVMSNEVVDGKKIGLQGLPPEMSKHGRRYYWHSDQQFQAIPAMASILHLKVLPERGDGDTYFASLTAAYDSLDNQMKERLQGLRAGCDVTKNVKPEYIFNSDQKKQLEKMPQVLHPVVRTHPETGRKSLFVSEGFTTAIEGWDPQESEELLQQLYQHTVQPQHVYRHQWKKGDMLFWDNRCTLHLATGSDQPRTLYRTTIQGTPVV